MNRSGDFLPDFRVEVAKHRAQPSNVKNKLRVVVSTGGVGDGCCERHC